MGWVNRFWMLGLALVVVFLAYTSVTVALREHAAEDGHPEMVRKFKVIADRYECLERVEQTPENLDRCDEWAEANNPPVEP